MADYPASAAGDSTLHVAVNNKVTTLTAGIDDTVTTIPVLSTTGFPSSGLVSIDSEIVSYTSIDATNFLGATRGADGTSAAAHGINSLVSHNIVAAHHNVLKDEVAAVETDLVGVQASLSDLSPAATASTILTRIRQIVTQLKAIAGTPNWYDTIASALTNKIDTAGTGLNKSSTTLNLTAPVSIANGGTNSIAALNNNRPIQSSGGAIVEGAALTANRVVTSDTNGLPTTSPSGDQTLTENLAFSPTTKGIKGTTTNDAAAAGNVGEEVIASTTGAAFPGSNVWGDLTSGITLTAGDWEIEAWFSANGNASTWSEIDIGVSTTSGNSSAGLTLGINRMITQFASTSTTITRMPIILPPQRVSLSSTTTYFMKYLAVYSAGAPAVDGGVIRARRVR